MIPKGKEVREDQLCEYQKRYQVRVDYPPGYLKRLEAQRGSGKRALTVAITVGTALGLGALAVLGYLCFKRY